MTTSGAFISPGTRPSRPDAIVRREANAGEPDALTVTQAPDGLTEGKAVTGSRTKSRSLCGYGIGIAAVSARTIRKMLPQVPYHPVAAIRQPRSVPDLGYPTRKADTKAVKTHSGGHRAAEARQTAEGGCRTRTHTRPPPQLRRSFHTDTAMRRAPSAASECPAAHPAGPNPPKRPE